MLKDDAQFSGDCTAETFLARLLLGLGNVELRWFTADPTVTGVDAPIGSLGLRVAGALGVYQKTGAATTAWTLLASAAGVVASVTSGSPLIIIGGTPINPTVGFSSPGPATSFLNAAGAYVPLGNPQRFLYTATGLEGNSFLVNLPAARASALYGVTSSCQGVASFLAIDTPAVLFTPTQFRCLTSVAPTAGDQLLFVVQDLT
jgi:hypothetical protein